MQPIDGRSMFGRRCFAPRGSTRARGLGTLCPGLDRAARDRLPCSARSKTQRREGDRVKVLIGIASLIAGAAIGLGILGIAGAYDEPQSQSPSGDIDPTAGKLTTEPPENYTPVAKPYRIGTVTDEDREKCSGPGGVTSHELPDGRALPPAVIEGRELKCKVVAGVDAGILEVGQELTDSEFSSAMSEVEAVNRGGSE